MVPHVNVVSELAELKQKEFLTFRKGLKDDSMVILKVLTAVDHPALHRV